MITPISPLIGTDGGYSQILPAAAAAAGGSKVSDEFLTIFYKELLKQVFKAPSLTMSDEKEENNVMQSYSSDLMLEQLAAHFARTGTFSAPWGLPAPAGLPAESGK